MTKTNKLTINLRTRRNQIPLYEIVNFIRKNDKGLGVSIECIKSFICFKTREDWVLLQALEFLAKRGHIYTNKPEHWKVL